MTNYVKGTPGMTKGFALNWDYETYPENNKGDYLIRMTDAMTGRTYIADVGADGKMNSLNEQVKPPTAINPGTEPVDMGFAEQISLKARLDEVIETKTKADAAAKAKTDPTTAVTAPTSGAVSTAAVAVTPSTSPAKKAPVLNEVTEAERREAEAKKDPGNRTTEVAAAYARVAAARAVAIANPSKENDAAFDKASEAYGNLISNNLKPSTAPVAAAAHPPNPAPASATTTTTPALAQATPTAVMPASPAMATPAKPAVVGTAEAHNSAAPPTPAAAKPTATAKPPKDIAGVKAHNPDHQSMKVVYSTSQNSHHQAPVAEINTPHHQTSHHSAAGTPMVRAPSIGPKLTAAAL